MIVFRLEDDLKEELRPDFQHVAVKYDFDVFLIFKTIFYM